MKKSYRLVGGTRDAEYDAHLLTRDMYFTIVILDDVLKELMRKGKWKIESHHNICGR